MTRLFFGWQVVAAAFAIAVLSWGAGFYGPPIFLGALLTATGLVGWGFAREPWQLFLATPFSGAGWALTSGAAINAMVSPWFDRRRPAALGMAFNGASMGGVISRRSGSH